jgi:carbon monoxide dehydrogenase subunit G
MNTTTKTVRHDIRFTLSPEQAAGLIADLASAIRNSEDADIRIVTDTISLLDSDVLGDLVDHDEAQVAHVTVQGRIMNQTGALVWSATVSEDGTEVDYDGRDLLGIK